MRFFSFLLLGVLTLLPLRWSHADSLCDDRGALPLNESRAWVEVLGDVIQELYPAYRLSVAAETCSPLSLVEEKLLLPALKGRTQFYTTNSSLPPVELHILASEKPNAFALPAEEDSEQASAQIFISQGLLNRLNARNELAFVLAHEMAHITKNHFPILPPFILTGRQLEHIEKTHHRWEFEADESAMQVLSERNMKLESPRILFERLTEAEATEKSHSGSVATHPSAEERVAALSGDRRG